MSAQPQSTAKPTPRETALIAAHVQRAAELRRQMDLMLMGGLTRDVEQQQA